MDNSYATRQLTLQRGYNFIGSAVALSVIVDGLEVAKLKVNEEISVSIPANSREIFFRNSTPFGPVDSTKYLIPAGNGNLICEIKVVPFKNDWSATFRQDNCAPNMFEQQITDFTVEKFRGTEVQSFLRHENNRRGDISFWVDANGLTIAFAAKETKGFDQWSTGMQQFKLAYAQIGISAPTTVSADFYGKLTERITQAILNDTESDWKKNEYGALYI